MNHEPSKYIGTVTLTYQQMWEVRKAISARVANWISEEQLGEKHEEIETLMGVGHMLDKHIDYAVDEWEDLVVQREIVDLDKSIDEMLKEDGDK